jgi:hypothetical protein
MSIGLQHAEVLLILKHIYHCITRTRTDSKSCLYVGVPLGGRISTCVAGSGDRGQAGEPETAAGSRRAVRSGELTRTSESLVAYPAVEMLQEALLVLHRQKQ